MSSIQYRSLSNVATETPLGIKCLICLTMFMNIFFLISFILQASMLNDMSQISVQLKHITKQLNYSL